MDLFLEEDMSTAAFAIGHQIPEHVEEVWKTINLALIQLVLASI